MTADAVLGPETPSWAWVAVVLVNVGPVGHCGSWPVDPVLLFRNAGLDTVTSTGTIGAIAAVPGEVDVVVFLWSAGEPLVGPGVALRHAPR